MKINRIFLLSIIVLLAACGKESTEEPPTVIIPPATDAAILKVMTYNIAGAAASTGVRSLEGLAEVIKRVDPDIVAIQEVDAFTTRNGKDVHLARDLAALCGMDHWFFAKAMDFHDGEYGDAIISKLPFKETMAYNLTGDWEGQRIETRSVARVTVEVGEGISVLSAPTSTIPAMKNGVSCRRKSWWRSSRGLRCPSLWEEI